MRDLAPMLVGDVVFFHIRGMQTIHGVYKVRTEPFFDQSLIWNDPLEKFPYRFLFEPHPNYAALCNIDANTDVPSLYRLIDRGEIRSLVTLEFEKNIERRSVRKILQTDAERIIGILHRDLHLQKVSANVSFDLMSPPPVAPLNNQIFKIGNQENAIKAVILAELARNSPNTILFKGQGMGAASQVSFKEYLSLPERYDFVNEFFIAPATRRLMDILVTAPRVHAIIEAKTHDFDDKALNQLLYYRDLLRQRPWVDDDDKVTAVAVAEGFSSSIKTAVRKINKIEEVIKLLRYVPNQRGNWARFEDDTP
jgi:hypothetical protein